MGNWRAEQQKQLDEQYELRRQEADKAREQKRMDLAGKIAMVVIDKINSDIIRPGPNPEERECYDVSQELREATPDLTAAIAAVLATEAKAS